MKMKRVIKKTMMMMRKKMTRTKISKKASKVARKTRKCKIMREKITPDKRKQLIYFTLFRFVSRIVLELLVGTPKIRNNLSPAMAFLL
jgi:hypothetical protein